MMSKDPLKTVNMIRNQKIIKPKAHPAIYRIREALNIYGLSITVKTENDPCEPDNNYTVFLGEMKECPDLLRVLINDKKTTVKVHSKLVNNQWKAESFSIPIEKPKSELEKQQELESQRAEYETYANY